MSKNLHARVLNNLVLEIFEGDVHKAFHPFIASQFIEVPDDTEVGMVKDSDNEYVMLAIEEPVIPEPIEEEEV
ncbi:MAG: hypothetical protein COA63_014090 [Methylophaga sp.]|nr:hypothetical protein [Methylophaga sp.]